MAIVILVVCSAGAFATHAVGKYFDDKHNEPKEVHNFDECVSAGYLLIGTYPEKCIDNLGNEFIREVLD